MKSKSTVKLGLAFGLFALAAVLFIAMKQGDDTPVDRPETVYFYCTACETGFDLRLDAPAETFRTVERDVDLGDGPQARRRSTKTSLEKVAKCTACGEFAGHPGRLCDHCQGSYRLTNKIGQVMVCPKCKWDPTTGQEAVDDRLSVLDSGG